MLLDSLHTADHVYNELKAYAHLVPVGGYVVVQDTVGGPIRGRKRFILQNTLEGDLRQVR